VADLGTDQDPDRVDTVEIRRDDGSRCFVRPRAVVLAAGGIENPRLLLLSNRTHRRGLGNDRDLVGRFFAERLSARSGYLAGGPELLRQASFYGVHTERGTRVQARSGSPSRSSASGSCSTARSSCCRASPP
jgi:choline dehydrogenase-like flavoprotein